MKDHPSASLRTSLGSASVVTDASGNIVGETRYFPYGETRFTTGTMYTDKLYTGQREMTGLGIYHYQARFYSPRLGRFLSPDTIIPVFENPQSWNRFSYAVNNPIRYNDPDGHCAPACPMALVPFVALAAVIVLTAIAIHPESRAAAIDCMEYMSGRTRNALKDLENKINDTNNDPNRFKIWRPCKENPQECLVWIVGIMTIGIVAIATGGTVQDPPLSQSSQLGTATPSLTPPGTSTPPATSTNNTPACPPYNNCPNTSTNTSTTTPTSTPTQTPTPPIFTPAPPGPGQQPIPI